MCGISSYLMNGGCCPLKRCEKDFSGNVTLLHEMDEDIIIFSTTVQFKQQQNAFLQAALSVGSTPLCMLRNL